MKKLFTIIAIAAAVLALGACSSAVSGPEAVAKKAMNAIQKGDFETYAKTFNLSESDQKSLAGLAEEKISESVNAKGGIKNFDIVDSTINEDKATVNVTINYKDGTSEDQKLSFVKVEDEWKQVLDK